MPGKPSIDHRQLCRSRRRKRVDASRRSKKVLSNGIGTRDIVIDVHTPADSGENAGRGQHGDRAPRDAREHR